MSSVGSKCFQDKLSEGLPEVEMQSAQKTCQILEPAKDPCVNIVIDSDSHSRRPDFGLKPTMRGQHKSIQVMHKKNSFKGPFNVCSLSSSIFV